MSQPWPAWSREEWTRRLAKEKRRGLAIVLVDAPAREELYAPPAPPTRVLYSPDQPRDKGQFAEVEGSGADSEQQAGEQQVGGVPNVDKVRNEIKTKTGITAYVADTPIARAIGMRLAEVLGEMKQRGYKMPSGVQVDHVQAMAPSASVSEGHFGAHLSVDIPEGLKNVTASGSALDSYVEAAFGGKTESGVDRFAGTTWRDTIVHEMGHVQHFAQGSVAVVGGDSAVKRGSAWQGVSEYAKTNQNEFVAEAFVRLYRGETLTPAAMRLYTRFSGPKVRQ